MKRSIALLLLAFTAATAHAGSFGGPPFQNGSPLLTGVDGAYQATTRAKNVTGIFRFRYSGGTQTATPTQNTWVFFMNGQIQRGSVVANINGSQLDGVLDSSVSSGTTTSTNGTLTLPIIFVNANNNSAGNFQGSLNLNSPTGAFSGKGQLSPAVAATNQIVGITTNAITGVIVVAVTNYPTAAGLIPVTAFKFTGVRTTTSSSTN